MALEFPKWMADTADVAQRHPVFAFAILAAVGMVAYVRPKQFFKVIAAALILGGLVYVVSFVFDLTEKGVDQKERLLIGPEERTMNRSE